MEKMSKMYDTLFAVTGPESGVPTAQIQKAKKFYCSQKAQDKLIADDLKRPIRIEFLEIPTGWQVNFFNDEGKAVLPFRVFRTN